MLLGQGRISYLSFSSLPPVLLVALRPASGLCACLRAFTLWQSRTGNKSELVAKILFCLEYGCLPHCPVCYTPRIKLAEKGKGFQCKGFYDDDEFRPCNFRSNGEGLTFVDLKWDH